MNLKNYPHIIEAVALTDEGTKYLLNQLVSRNEDLSRCISFGEVIKGPWKLLLRIDFSDIENGDPRLDADIYELKGTKYLRVKLDEQTHHTSKKPVNGEWVYDWQGFNKGGFPLMRFRLQTLNQQLITGVACIVSPDK